jgi:uncharacterized protein YktA (UPF0223 family)
LSLLVWRDKDGKTPQEKEKIIQERSEFMSRWIQVVYSKTEVEFHQKWCKLLDNYKGQRELCNYLTAQQYPTRYEWAAPWTSLYRHYRTITSSPIEGMHKVLKDYLATSQGNLFSVVQKIKEMIFNQYIKYRTNIASAKHTLKFEHKPEAMPFLPPGIHKTITPAAIELVRKQDLLSQKHHEEGYCPPCTGSFEKIHGLPCYHAINRSKDWGLGLSYNNPH